jgi:hypothetical protein
MNLCGYKMARTAKLSPTERARRADACKRAWVQRNAEYNRLQKRIIAGRPDRLAKRREQYREMRETLLYEAQCRAEVWRGGALCGAAR